MTNIVPISTPLAVLAARISKRLAESEDSLLLACVDLAEAKAECLRQGITFKDWVAENISGRGYTYLVRLARIGQAPDPAKALADLRAARRDGMARRRAVAPRGTTPKVYPPEEFDEEELEVVDTDDSYRRRRAFLYRAREAVDFALVDNMDGLELSREIVDVARKVAQAWTELADRLEHRYGSA
jgi:hypothetical protein